MDHPLTVGGVNRPGEGFETGGGVARRLRPAGQLLVQAAAGDQFHDNERPAVLFARLDQLHHVGMHHTRQRGRLTAEARALMRAVKEGIAKYLEGEEPASCEVTDLVNDAHAPVAELGEDLVTGNGKRPQHDRASIAMAVVGGWLRRDSRLSAGGDRGLIRKSQLWPCMQ